MYWFYVVFFSSDVTSVVRVVPSLQLRVMLLLRLRTAVDLVVVVVVPVCVCVNIKKSEDSKETFGSTSIIERKKIKRWDENVKRYICTQVHEREREREGDSERVREREKEKERTLTRRVRFEKNFETRFADSQIPSSIPYSVVSTPSLIFILLYQCYISGLWEKTFDKCQMSSLKGTNDFFGFVFWLTVDTQSAALWELSTRSTLQISMYYLLVEYVYYCCINAKLRSRRIAVSSG